MKKKYISLNNCIQIHYWGTLNWAQMFYIHHTKVIIKTLHIIITINYAIFHNDHILLISIE